MGTLTDGLHIGLLGPLAANHAGMSALALASAAQRRLVSILALEGGRVVSAERLCEILECSPGSLRTTVSRLRASLGADHVHTTPPGYALVATTDVAEFEQLLAEGRRAPPSTAVEPLERAIALWRGEAVEEFRHEPWALPAVARLDELRATAIELRAEAMVEEGQAEEAIADLTSHIARHPLRERPVALLMQALSAGGRSTEALRVYQGLRRHLVEHTGTEPSEATRSIERQIAVGTAGASPADAITPEAPRAFLFTGTDGGTDGGTCTELARAIEANHGVAILTGPGATAAMFDTAADAVRAALDAGRALASATGVPEEHGLRMGVHYGPAARRADRWFGPTVDQGLRIADLGHAGQLLVSEIVASMLDVRLTDLGEHQLRDVEGRRRLFQVDVPGGPARFPPLRSIGSYRTTLPAQRTSLIGRDELVARVRALLDEHRLVTLLGPGGVGKTRLAIEVAGQALGGFPGGVFFADLTRADTGSGVASELLRSMKAGARAGQPEADAIGELLAERTALLVVDNCEHVAEPAAEVIDDVLVSAGHARVLATSRQPLDLLGERRFIVPSLDVDGPSSAAVRLFVDRAMAISDTALPDDADRVTVAEITRRLDGMPLAIELAAAQVAAFPPSTILDHLDDRFALLATTQRRVPLRQQTLAATIEWSYRLLDPEEQRALRILATCAGPFSPSTAARALARPHGEAAALLESLCARSLLVDVPAGGERLGYTFLETLREYGREQSAHAGDAHPDRLALEEALLPSSEAVDDWTTLVNTYLCAPDPAMMIEDATRLAAATRALDEHRLDQAAYLFSSVAYRGEVGALRSRMETVRSLAGRRSELQPMAWLAACATELLLARAARDYGTCLEVATDVLAELEPGDPARGWFETRPPSRGSRGRPGAWSWLGPSRRATPPWWSS